MDESTSRETITINTVITTLEMTEKPARPTVPLPPGKLALLRMETPNAGFYRYLYTRVGTPWLWWQRRDMEDEALAALIGEEGIHIYVLYAGGAPAGYVELDRRQEDNVELAYFGLMPEFIGRGLGWYLLNWAVDSAWTGGPHRVWLHTCDLDHPRALQLYQKAGFRVCSQEPRTDRVPRRLWDQAEAARGALTSAELRALKTSPGRD